MIMITVELESYQRGKKGTEKKLLNAARPSRLFKTLHFHPGSHARPTTDSAWT